MTDSGVRSFDIGDDYVHYWYSRPVFRDGAIVRCNTIAEKFGCVVELRSKAEGVLYKVFSLTPEGSAAT
jgi:hypothetical protein